MKRLIASVKQAQEKAAQWFQGGPPERAERFDEVQEREKEEIVRLRAFRLADLVIAAFDRQTEDSDSLKLAKNLENILVDSPLRDCFETYMEYRSCETRPVFLRQLAEALPENPTLRERIGKELKCEVSPDLGHVGLALSGGGIRSATFNLGVLQALAKLKLLYHFDYLSTVSGGGYIGSWLIAWIKRQGFEAVNQQLKPQWKEHGGQEPPQIRFLRDYSNYLTPQLGAFSADTWTAVTSYCRNLLLNQAILLAWLAAVLLVPWLGVAGFQVLTGYVTLVAGLALLYASFGFFAWRIWTVWSGQAPEIRGPGKQGQVLLPILIPLLAGAYLLTPWITKKCWLWDNLSHIVLFLVVIVVVILLVMWGLFSLGDAGKVPAYVLPLALGSYALLSLLASIWVVTALANRLDNRPSAPFHIFTVGVPLYLLVTLAAGGLQVGLTGLLFRNYMREWTARLGAWILIVTLAWATLGAIAFYSPALLMWGWERVTAWIAGAGGLLGLVYGVAGLYAAWSQKSGKPSASNWRDILARSLPPIVALALLCVLSLFIYKRAVLEPINTRKPPSGASLTLTWTSDCSSGSTTLAPCNDRPETLDALWKRYWESMKENGTPKRAKGRGILFVFAGLLMVAVFLSLRVDINDFSMHLFYRNRLVRAYLGASRPPEESTDLCRRTADRFTGFDPQDDVLLARLASKSPPGDCEEIYAGPYPILNAALNLTHGEKLAWQERKAESFVFTPLYCGGTLNRKEAYRPTDQYSYSPQGNSALGGPYLGTALSISGAAVSPNMGYYSSAPVAFMMTFFNVRLGQWLRNPAAKNSDCPGPKFGLWYLLCDLFGSADERRAFVYLSDGGHFENLGIYELVRRKCRLIVACDATADGDYKFGDLGNAIRKCRDDFGVDIELDLKPLRGRRKPKRTESHVAIGTIHYENTFEGEKPGVLLYIKASLTKNGDEPADVLEYAATHTDFPHDSTADQWFSESQFESYRMLGQHILEEAEEDKVMSLIEKSGEWTGLDAERLKDYLKKRSPSLYSPPDTSANASGV